MIIESEEYPDIDVMCGGVTDGGMICQDTHIVVIDKQQAAQLFEVLQRWVNGEEIE
ncbi:hypothetical protein [Salmonella enterica]|uniref:Uncharacterized protein n=1 Tax=Salmonella phage vB_Se_STGO-35-1 TaxID=2749381 RepID=A0A889IN58_9CAUD|nr:hypothetical protein [Salmonella enterica]YP_010054025.1 hypothetical protein KGB48_gp05 [Salmonella phage vB_Se_STGO-35-1]EGM9390217.1 hypothetical protein [Salmonella enterica]QRD99740.1 hypothetical protein JKL37_0004 [Salmonella phage vB_Se_STGO-35-1]